MLTAQKDVINKSLYSSEQLFISGGSGVRAYAEGASGDNGYVANLEFRYALPRIKLLPKQQSLAAFFDNGAIQAQKNGASLTNFVLSGVGAGYSINVHSAFANVQWAHSLGAIKSHNETDHDHVWLQVGYVF